MQNKIIQSDKTWEFQVVIPIAHWYGSCMINIEDTTFRIITNILNHINNELGKDYNPRDYTLRYAFQNLPHGVIFRSCFSNFINSKIDIYTEAYHQLKIRSIDQKIIELIKSLKEFEIVIDNNIPNTREFETITSFISPTPVNRATLYNKEFIQLSQECVQNTECVVCQNSNLNAHYEVEDIKMDVNDDREHPNSVSIIKQALNKLNQICTLSNQSYKLDLITAWVNKKQDAVEHMKWSLELLEIFHNV